jgi:hypothetical protein
MKRRVRVTAIGLAALVLGAGLPTAASAQPAGGWAGGWTGGGPAPALGPAPAPMVRPLAPDPIDQSKALSTRGVPSAGPQSPMAYRLVPERRVLVPGTSREIVIPSYYERLQPDGSWQAPPVTGYGTRGEGPVYVPEPRQAAP